jgi:hypothetical protein
MAEKLRIGNMLVEAGLINDFQLRRALSDQLQCLVAELDTKIAAPDADGVMKQITFDDIENPVRSIGVPSGSLGWGRPWSSSRSTNYRWGLR